MGFLTILLMSLFDPLCSMSVQYYDMIICLDRLIFLLAYSHALCEMIGILMLIRD